MNWCSFYFFFSVLLSVHPFATQKIIGHLVKTVFQSLSPWRRKHTMHMHYGCLRTIHGSKSSAVCEDRGWNVQHGVLYILDVRGYLILWTNLCLTEAFTRTLKRFFNGMSMFHFYVKCSFLHRKHGFGQRPKLVLEWWDTKQLVVVFFRYSTWVFVLLDRDKIM